MLELFDVVGVYGILTLVGYLMPSLYIYIKYIWFVNILLIRFLKEPRLIHLHAVKWFQVLLWITNNSIKPQSFVYTQLNDQTILFQTIQFCMRHLFSHSLYVKQFYLTHRVLSSATTPG